MAYDYLSASNEILKAARENSKSLTPLQLIKLLYMAHGFSLAIYDRPLITEPIQAWKHGPVVKSLYRKVKEHGKNKIVGPLSRNPVFDASEQEVDPQDSQLINALVRTWGGLSGIALSNWTHLPGSPWYQTYLPNVADIVIPNDLIAQYFKSFIEKNKRDALDGSASTN
jgi:uncharacterized phage-associated protein